MAASAEPALGPLLDLLREATDARRPAVTLTPRRAAEVLGGEPTPEWWAERTADLRSAGFTLTVDPDRGWLAFTPAVATRAAEVSVTVTWRDEDEPTVAVSGRGELSLADPAVQALVRAARTVAGGGGSGI